MQFLLQTTRDGDSSQYAKFRVPQILTELAYIKYTTAIMPSIMVLHTSFFIMY
jgi:hypothetical protein